MPGIHQCKIYLVKYNADNLNIIINNLIWSIRHTDKHASFVFLLRVLLLCCESKIETLDATIVNSCGVQDCKKLNENVSRRCCRCSIFWENENCEMLNQREKVELYFEEALPFDE